MFEMLLTPRTARLEGLGLFVVAPLSRGETAIREEEGFFLSCCHSPGPVVFLQIPLIFTSAPTREASCYRRDAAAAPAVLDLPAAELFQAFGSGSQTSVSKASLI